MEEVARAAQLAMDAAEPPQGGEEGTVPQGEEGAEVHAAEDESGAAEASISPSQTSLSRCLSLKVALGRMLLAIWTVHMLY